METSDGGAWTPRQIDILEGREGCWMDGPLGKNHEHCSEVNFDLCYEYLQFSG